MNKMTDINLSLPACFIHVGKRVAQILDERLHPVGLSSAKLWTLHSIVTTDELDTLVTVTCLADTMNTTKSNVTAMVDRLIADGLITRNHGVDDRRTVVIALTEEGRRRYEEGLEMVHVFHNELSEGFSAEEQHLLNGLMNKLSL